MILLTSLAPTLLIGNSYTARNDLAGVVAGLYAAAGVADSPESLTADGLTWAGHVERIEGGAPGWSDALAVARPRVILQEQSQIPGFPADHPEWIASLEAARTLHGLAGGAETWLFVTWGRRDGDRDNPDIYPDFPTMNDRLEAGYLAVAADLPAHVAPVGRGWRVVWDDASAAGEDPLAPGSRFDRLYSEDGSHPSTLGTLLAACVIVTSTTGTPCADLPAPGVDPADAAWVADAADRAVLGSTDLVFPWTADPPADTDEAPVDPGESADTGCGCAHAPAPAWWLAGAAALIARRRR